MIGMTLYNPMKIRAIFHIFSYKSLSHLIILIYIYNERVTVECLLLFFPILPQRYLVFALESVITYVPAVKPSLSLQLGSIQSKRYKGRKIEASFLRPPTKRALNNLT